MHELKDNPQLPIGWSCSSPHASLVMRKVHPFQEHMTLFRPCSQPLEEWAAGLDGLAGLGATRNLHDASHVFMLYTTITGRMIMLYATMSTGRTLTMGERSKRLNLTGMSVTFPSQARRPYELPI